MNGTPATTLVDLTITVERGASPVVELASYGDGGVPVQVLRLTWHPEPAERLELARRAAARAWGLDIGRIAGCMDLTGRIPGVEGSRVVSIFHAVPIPAPAITSGDTQNEGARP